MAGRAIRRDNFRIKDQFKMSFNYDSLNQKEREIIKEVSNNSH